MYLSKLPDEILVEIFKTLDSPKDRSHVSQTSQKLHDIMEPILYSSFVQTGGGATPNFIRSILKKPSRAQYVKSVTARAICAHGSLSELDPVWDLFAGLEASIMKVIGRESTTDQRTNWLKDFYDARWDACTAVLLFLLPSVEHLDLRLFNSMLNNNPYSLQPRYLLKALSMPLGNSVLADCKPWQYFRWKQPLQNVSVENWEEYGPILKILQSFIGYESIKNLRLVGVDDSDLDGMDAANSSEYLTEVLQLLGNLTGLSLLSADIDPDKLEILLSSCSHLRYLHYVQKESLLYEDGDMDLGYFCPGAFGRGIKYLEDSLEELVVTCNDYWLNSRPYEHLGSLNTFKALRVLEITECILLGRDKTNNTYHGWDRWTQHWGQEELAKSISKLPPSLEQLTILNCRTDIFDWLGYLFEGLERSEIEWGNLKKISCIFLETASLLPNDSRGREVSWHERARNLGIQFMNRATPEVIRCGPPGNIFDFDDFGEEN
ncbi:hypothetical protein IFR05_006192 [Cadophora sp. M221]|nr:hypothetical protein IFR05_006192 [Cadophora sp. M221]